jgi:hypothetical protein
MGTLNNSSPPPAWFPSDDVADSKKTVPSGATDTFGTPGSRIDTLVANVRTTRPVAVETTTTSKFEVQATISGGAATAAACR